MQFAFSSLNSQKKRKKTSKNKKQRYGAFFLVELELRMEQGRDEEVSGWTEKFCVIVSSSKLRDESSVQLGWVMGIESRSVCFIHPQL